MPNRLSKEGKFTALQDNFILAYTSFGMDTYFNGHLSMIAAGSKAKSANALMVGACNLLSEPKIREKIEAIETTRKAQLMQKTGLTLEQAEFEYEQARQHAITLKQPASEVSAVTGKARLYGMDKDAGTGEKTVIIISPKVSKVIDNKELSNE